MMVSLYHNEVSIPLDEITLNGILFIPFKVNGIIIFCLGSGSSRFSKRNQEIASYFQEKNFGTLLFDLLTLEEDKNFKNRFNIDLLADRLVGSTRWLQHFPAADECCLGYFSVSTEAAAAVSASNQIPEIQALVMLNGRPELASKNELKNLKTPTLMIVGNLDKNNLDLNTQTFQMLEGEKELQIIEGASHLFEEDGKLQMVKELSSNWFLKHLDSIHA